VRYGNNGTYFYATFTGGVSCNNGVFGDPLFGTAKNCEYGNGTSQSSSSSTTTPTNNTSWNYCASEGGQCNFSGTREVRYGANGNYSYGIFSNGVSCNNGVFGDPLFGTAKNCEYGGDGATQSSSSSPTTTTNNTTTTSGPSGSGKRYYVATNGNNSNSCATATNINSPKRTITGGSGGLTCLLAGNGDSLEIRGGTYAENITTSTQPIASGTNWDNATVIKGYANETVTLAPTNGAGAIAMEKSQYVIFANLVIDGSQSPNSGAAAIWFGTTNSQANPPSHHLRFQNIEVKNWYGTNVEAYGDYSEILDSSFHDNRRNPLGYGIYTTGHDNIFEGNEIFNHSAYGVHNYCNGCATGMGPSRNIYRFNEIYNTGYDLVNSPSALLLQSGDGIQAYGNIVHDNAYFGIGINGTNTVVSDNTVVGNRYGIAYGLGINSTITNNSVYQNSTDWWNVSNNTATNPQ
jgi:parallel beta-helix repeat protein